MSRLFQDPLRGFQRLWKGIRLWGGGGCGHRSDILSSPSPVKPKLESTSGGGGRAWLGGRGGGGPRPYVYIYMYVYM